MKLPGEFVPWVLSHDLHCRAFLWHNQDQDQWSQTPRIIAHQTNRLIHPVIGFIDSLKPGFHMIATIAEKKKVQRSYEKSFSFSWLLWSLNFFFSAIIWKPGLNVLWSGCSWITDSDPDHPKGTHPQQTSLRDLFSVAQEHF